MVTIRKNNIGSFYFKADGSSTEIAIPRNLVCVSFEAETQKLSITVNRLNKVDTLFPFTHFSQILNGDADDIFGSFIELQQYCTDNIMQIGDTSTLTGLVVGIGAGEYHIGSVGGNTNIVSASVTRPANTTAYDINDVIGTASPTMLTFTNIARLDAGNGYITKAKIITNQASNQAAYRLHLYNDTITAIADNASNTLLFANNAKYIGYIDFITPVTAGGSSDCAFTFAGDIRIAYNCKAASKNLYGVLETLSAFTPVSAQQFVVELSAENN